MNTTSLLQLCGAAACLTLASCALWPYPNSHDAAKRDGEGYSLDNPASGSRYMAGADNTASTTHTETSTVTGPSSTVETTKTTTESGPPLTKPAPTTGTSPGPAATVTPPAPQTPAAPTYGTPVPGRRGFVYPPGVDTKPENMVDVRDFQPGQKVRDPRTGKIFLVP
jgi:hypothetical protein